MSFVSGNAGVEIVSLEQIKTFEEDNLGVTRYVVRGCMTRREAWYDWCVGHPLIEQTYAGIEVQRADSGPVPQPLADAEDYRAVIRQLDVELGVNFDWAGPQNTSNSNETIAVCGRGNSTRMCDSDPLQ